MPLSILVGQDCDFFSSFLRTYQFVPLYYDVISFPQTPFQNKPLNFTGLQGVNRKEGRVEPIFHTTFESDIYGRNSETLFNISYYYTGLTLNHQLKLAIAN